MKKIMLVFLLMFSMLIGCTTVPGGISTVTTLFEGTHSSTTTPVTTSPVTTSPIATQLPEKIIWNGSIDQDFSDNDILFMVYPKWNEKEYTIEDFAEVGCIAIREILSAKPDKDEPTRAFIIELNKNDKQNVIDCIRILEQREDIYYAEPNYLLHLELETSPNDMYYEQGKQWAIDAIDLPLAWNLTTGSADVMVGVIDTGVDGTHPDLVNRINTELSRSFTTASTNPLQDPNGHGTHVAGIIGAEGNNTLGVVGVCWNVEIVSLRIINNLGVIEVNAVVDAIEYAEATGIPILNFSVGTYDYSVSVSIKAAIEAYSGLFVTSAGNSEIDTDVTAHYPSSFDCDNIVSVGNSTSEDNRSSTSNWGAISVDIFAPGTSIFSTEPGGSYQLLSGTSMASPYVAGVAALILSVAPNTSVAEMKSAIIEHPDIVRNETGEYVFSCVSHGRLNAYKALSHFSVEEYVANNIYTHCCTYLCGCYDTEAHQWIRQGNLYYCRECEMTARNIPTIDPWNIPTVENDE